MLNISKYNEYWFQNASLDELNAERDVVQWQGLNNTELDDDFREECRELLCVFDEWIRKNNTAMMTVGHHLRTENTGGIYLEP